MPLSSRPVHAVVRLKTNAGRHVVVHGARPAPHIGKRKPPPPPFSTIPSRRDLPLCGRSPSPAAYCFPAFPSRATSSSGWPNSHTISLKNCTFLSREVFCLRYKAVVLGQLHGGNWPLRCPWTERGKGWHLIAKFSHTRSTRSNALQKGRRSICSPIPPTRRSSSARPCRLALH